jgi:hypothetical protein
MGRFVRQGVFLAFVAIGASWAMPARAFEPITTFLFYMAREIMFDAYTNSENPQNRAIEPLPAVYPGTMVEPAQLRALIDNSFIYLSARRREQLFQSFNDELLKPKNAAVRGAMIAYFAEHAQAVRKLMERLSKLNVTEMRELSVRFSLEARELPEEDLEKLRQVLENGLLPVPPDLNARLVLAISDIPTRPSETPAAGDAAAPAAATATDKATAAGKDGAGQGDAKPSREAAPLGEAGPPARGEPLSPTKTQVQARTTVAAPAFTE